MHPKTYYQFLLDFNSNPGKAKESFLDKRLTQTEKKIIEGFFYIRNNQNEEAEALIKSLPPSGIPFVESHKHVIHGIALNNMARFKEAEECLLKSLPGLKELNAHFFVSMAYFNLYLIYANTGQKVQMKAALDELAAVPIEIELQKMRILRCQFDYYAEINDFEQAQNILAQLNPLKDSMPESDIVSHLVCEFIYYIKIEDFSACEKVLGEMKRFRKFNLTENFNYMKKLLDHLIHHAPIYLAVDEMIRTPLLYHEIRVIHALEENNTPQAEQHWDQLAKMSPTIYGPNMEYNGPKSIFSLCLNKYALAKPVTSFKINPDRSLLDNLLHILLNAEGPVQKGSLYESLWGNPPESKEDLKKLSRLMSKIRTDKGYEVISRKGSYMIEKSNSKKRTA